MPHTIDANERSHSTVQACCPGDLLGELQQALADLADVEDRYEADRNCLDRDTELSGSIRSRLGTEVDRRYRAERAPCVERLERLAKDMIITEIREELSQTPSYNRAVLALRSE
jgi:hypothetical protein